MLHELVIKALPGPPKYLFWQAIRRHILRILQVICLLFVAPRCGRQVRFGHVVAELGLVSPQSTFSLQGDKNTPLKFYHADKLFKVRDSLCTKYELHFCLKRITSGSISIKFQILWGLSAIYSSQLLGSQLWISVYFADKSFAQSDYIKSCCRPF